MNEINDFIMNLPESRARKRTYLEIMQVSTRETIMANLLAYYFQPNEEHGLGDLFIRALLQTSCYDLKTHTQVPLPDEICRLKDKKITWAKVYTEDVTGDNKRIDIVIETDLMLIAIEFKINHSLNNPLNIYADHISNSYPSDKPKYFVVLTPVWKKPEKEFQINFDFRQVLINHFIEEVDNIRKNDPVLNTRTDLKYQYLIDLISTFQNRKITFEMIQKYQKKVYEDNDFQNKINQVYSDLQEIKLDLEKKMSQINNDLNDFSPIGSSKNKLQTVIEKKLGSKDTIKLRLNLKEWRLEQWSQKQKLEDKTIHFPYHTNPEKIIAKIKSLEGECIDSVQ